MIVDIINVNETLTDIALDNDIVEENISGAAIATISITDPDTVATFRNNTVTVNDSRFEVINNNGIIQLKLKRSHSSFYLKINTFHRKMPNNWAIFVRNFCSQKLSKIAQTGHPEFTTETLGIILLITCS